jgi:hypothetical protein
MNASKSTVLGTVSNIIAIMLIGLSIGWLVGLSSSSLLSIVTPVLLTLIASGITAVQLISKPAADAPLATSLYGIAVFVIGLSAGGSLGTMARLGEWLSPDPAQAIERWRRWSQVIPHDEVVRRVFERDLPDPAGHAPSPGSGSDDAVLQGDAACRAVVAKADTLGLDDLKAALRESEVPWASAVAPIHDVETLRSVAKNLCH